MPLIPNPTSEEGFAIGEHLARWVDVQLASHPDRPDPRCSSCAFRAGTHPNGSLSTVADALKCLMEDDRFDCHEGMIDGSPTRPCGGWATLAAATPGRDGHPVMPWPYSGEPGGDRE